jgi:hypothetical protein
MRLVWVRQETHHRGYRIEGQKHGEGMLLRVSPTRLGLPELAYSRFRTIQAPWPKAVSAIARYIDGEIARQVRCEANERLRNQIRDKLKLVGAELVAETPTASASAGDKTNLATYRFPKRTVPPPH